MYGGFEPADYPQDLTFSPDFPSDAEALAQIYEQSGGQPVDGVIKIDPVALAALLRFTGPIQVPGIDEPLTSENAADILMRSQYLQEGERGDALVEATRIAFDKLTSGSLPGPQQLVDDARADGPPAPPDAVVRSVPRRRRCSAASPPTGRSRRRRRATTSFR